MSRNFLKRSFKNTLAIVGVGSKTSKDALAKNDNFILKEKDDGGDSVPEVKIMLNRQPSEVRNNHKTVIYFGDSIARRAGSPLTDMDDDSLKKYDFSSETVTTDSSVSNRGESSHRGRDLPPFIDSVVDGVINIKIEGNFKKANELVRKLSMKGNNQDNQKQKDNDNFDWGFVQEWRKNRLVKSNI